MLLRRRRSQVRMLRKSVQIVPIALNVRSDRNGQLRRGRGMSSTSGSPVPTRAQSSSRVGMIWKRSMRRSSTRRMSRTSTWPTGPLRSRLDSLDLLPEAVAVLGVVVARTTIAVAVAVDVLVRVAVVAVDRGRGARVFPITHLSSKRNKAVLFRDGLVVSDELYLSEKALLRRLMPRTSVAFTARILSGLKPRPTSRALSKQRQIRTLPKGLHSRLLDTNCTIMPPQKEQLCPRAKEIVER